MVRLACALILVLGAGTVRSATSASIPQDTPSSQAAAIDWPHLSIDELITRLPPVTGEWRWNAKTSNWVDDPAVAELKRRIESADDAAASKLMSDKQWLRALQRTGAIRVREAWPRDLPYSVSVDVPTWLGRGRISIEPKTPGLKPKGIGEVEPVECGTYAIAAARDAKAGLTLGRVEGEPKQIVLQVTIEQGKRLDLGTYDTRTLWKGTLRVPFKRVASWDEALTPADPKLADAIRDSLGAGVREWGDACAVPYIVIDPDCAKCPALASIALDFKVELIDDGKVVESSELVALDVDIFTLLSSVQKDVTVPRLYGSTNFEKVSANQPATDAESTRWSVRFTGQTKHAAYAWSAQHRWVGSITVSWSDLRANEARRTGPQGRGPEASAGYFR